MIRWEVDDRVAVATIDRTERRNALNVELCTQLREHLERERDHRAIVITGAGTAFCAGADLVTRFEGADDDFRPVFEAALEAIIAYPAPVIAAINGPAIGAGTYLSVACDLRVAAPSATFGIPAAKLGIVVNAENVIRLALLVGHGHARDLLLTGRQISVGEALRIGLVHRLAGNDTLADALDWAREIAALAPLTLAGHKRILNELTRHLHLSRRDDADVLSALDALAVHAFHSNDLKEGLAAFAEKRPPRFEGR